MSRLIGNPTTLRAFSRNLSNISTVLAQRVAERGAPVITSMAGASYDSGKTAYDEARPLGVAGNSLDLVVSSKARDSLRFVATGTRIRCVLGPRWAKFLVGKYKVLPQSLPEKWSKALGDIANDELAKQVAA